MKFFSLIFLLSIFLSCAQPAGKQKDADGNYKERIALMEADKQFSEMSVQKGMREAFIEFIDSNGVLLRPNHMPIVGAHAIDYLIQHNDNGFVMKWQPHHAVVSESADLGYTYGVWAITPSEVDTVLYGTYVSIWRRQQDGSWKFVLDSGNEGIGTQ